MPWFFSYGLGTNVERTKKDVGSFERYQTGTLNGFVYTFTGNHPEFDGGGTSTLIPVRGGVVLGVAYEVSDGQLSSLVENGHGYELRENRAVLDGAETPVYTLQPREIKQPNRPSDRYLSMIREGLTQHYQPPLVELYLGRALKRTSAQTELPHKAPTADSFKREYGVDLRRLFPWAVTKTSQFGSAWAVVNPGEETEPQAHDEEETFIIVHGEGMMNLDGREFPVGKGDTVYIEPFSAHALRNESDSPLEVLCVWWGGVTAS